VASAADAERRIAVIDLGSNSFRLVVYASMPHGRWRRTDEIYDPVRIAADVEADGRLRPERMDRALRTLDLYAHFCRATGLVAAEIKPVATSAIRDAANRDELVARVRSETGLDVRVLTAEAEARYGYLAAVNSTTLTDRAVLDVGGGSVQLVAVGDRRMGDWASCPLGSVRMTERFLPGKRASKKQLKALRAHVREQVAGAGWLEAAGERLVGIGGTVRNLAVAAQRHRGLPPFGVQGFVLSRDVLGDLVGELASMPVSQRGGMEGIKPERGDVILAGAAVIEATLEAGGFEAIEVTEEGMREGVFFEDHLAPADPPLFRSVRRASVENLAARYDTGVEHVRHVAALALQMFDALERAGLHPGDRTERELLWAAAMLHDIGATVDYDDHHKHSRYLVLSAGLPGYEPREVALVAQIARYHRKGSPGFGELAPLMRDGDDALLARCAALLRVAEQLERSRDQLVRETRLALDDGAVRLELVADGDASVARWAAERQADVFERAFGRRLEIAG
jgi:exopolyphosphatase/guanosine-5'-triphosphate,3'-diphosphate pyrophosphatase